MRLGAPYERASELDDLTIASMSPMQNCNWVGSSDSCQSSEHLSKYWRCWRNPHYNPPPFSKKTQTRHRIPKQCSLNNRRIHRASDFACDCLMAEQSDDGYHLSRVPKFSTFSEIMTPCGISWDWEHFLQTDTLLIVISICIRWTKLSRSLHSLQKASNYWWNPLPGMELCRAWKCVRMSEVLTTSCLCGWGRAPSSHWSDVHVGNMGLWCERCDSRLLSQ